MTNNATDLQLEVAKASLEVVKEIGFMGYRFLITLNSGAFIVMLTFIGNIDSNEAFVLDLNKLKFSMMLFLCAIAGTFLSMTITYVAAQLKFENRHLPLGGGFWGHMFWMLVPTIFSFICFFAGSAIAILGISAQ